MEKPQPLFFNAPTDLIKKKKNIYISPPRKISPPFFLAWLFVTLSISRRYFARFSCFYQRAPLRNFSELCLQTNCSKYCENKITSRLQHIKKIIFLIISLENLSRKYSRLLNNIVFKKTLLHHARIDLNESNCISTAKEYKRCTFLM